MPRNSHETIVRHCKMPQNNCKVPQNAPEMVWRYVQDIPRDVLDITTKFQLCSLQGGTTWAS